MSHINILQPGEDLFDPTTRQTVRDRLLVARYALILGGKTDDQTVRDDRFLERVAQHLTNLGIDHLPDESAAQKAFYVAMEQRPGNTPFAEGTIDADMTWNQLILDAWKHTNGGNTP